ncbi:MAG TPA: DUF2270 domain-containing protein [Pyrinomonadaceae bacterium]|jgi:uncharacterized membrane protein
MKTDLRPRATDASAVPSKTIQPARPAPPDAPETAPIHQTLTPEQAAVVAQAPRPAAPARRVTPAEFNMAMVHFYRGEVTRANTWRNRLDTTTNWAVLTTGATLSFAFSVPTNPHFVILINTVLVGFFLFMEARRYRYYEIWSGRVRMLETGYFTHLLSPDSAAGGDDTWIQMLVADLQAPRFNISEAEALGRRLRRNYFWIFMLLAACWNLKVYMHPYTSINLADFVRKADIGLVPGEIVIMMGIVFNVILSAFALFTMRLRQATGEVLTEPDFHPFQRVGEWTRAAATTTKRRAATVRRAKRARARTRSTVPRPAGSGTTGEWPRADIHRSQPPEDIHRTQFPNRDKVIK